MRNKLFSVLLGLLTVLVTVIVLGRIGQADDVPTAGLTGNEARVTDRYGNVITDTSQLSKWEDFTVEYDWAIRNGQPIAAGDTELPNGTLHPLIWGFH